MTREEVDKVKIDLIEAKGKLDEARQSTMRLACHVADLEKTYDNAQRQWFLETGKITILPTCKSHTSRGKSTPKVQPASKKATIAAIKKLPEAMWEELGKTMGVRVD